MAKDNTTAKDVMNFYIDPNCIEVVEEFGRFIGETSIDFIDDCIRGKIGAILDDLQNIFPEYSEDVAKRLDIKL